MNPTFEQYMLQNGMDDPEHLPAAVLAEWKQKYAAAYPAPAAAATPPAPASIPNPTFEQYMLHHGMNAPDKLPPAALAKWKQKYATAYPPPTPAA